MTTITAQSAIGNFTKGQKIKKDATIAAYYRAITNEDRETELTIPDSDILAIVNSIAGDDANAEVERVELIEAREKQTADDADPSRVVISISGRGGEARAIAAELARHPDIVTTLQGFVMAKETVAKGARDLYLALQSAQMLGKLPKPGTTVDGRKLSKKGPDTEKAENYDLYWVAGQTAKGNATQVQHSTLEEIARSFPFVEAYQAEKDAASKDATLAPTVIEQIARKNNKRMQAAIGALKDCSGIHHQMVALDNYENVNVSLVMDVGADGTETPASTSEPFWIENPKDAKRQFKQLAVRAFLSLDPVAAMTDPKVHGGTPGSYAALVKTLARAPQVPTTTLAAVTGQTFDPTLTGVVAFLANEDNYEFVRKNVAKHDATGDDTLHCLDVLQEYIDNLTGKYPNRCTVLRLKAKGQPVPAAIMAKVEGPAIEGVTVLAAPAVVPAA